MPRVPQRGRPSGRGFLFKRLNCAMRFSAAVRRCWRQIRGGTFSVRDLQGGYLLLVAVSAACYLCEQMRVLLHASVDK